MSYFVIYNSEGETSVEQISKEILTKRLQAEANANDSNFDAEYYGKDIEFLSEIKDTDTNYWGDVILIIKGEIVVPEPVDVVKEYKI